jgi:hypothetical protein
MMIDLSFNFLADNNDHNERFNFDGARACNTFYQTPWVIVGHSSNKKQSRIMAISEPWDFSLFG